MQHLDSLASLSLSESLVTIGIFDGVHLGHQSILHDIVRASRVTGDPSVVVTFYPHPALVLGKKKGPYYLTNPQERAELIAEQGVDYVITLYFDEQLARVSADSFLETLQSHLHFQALWAGENFAFGRNREGTVEYLEAARQQVGFEFFVIPPRYTGGKIVSSSRVREAVRQGDVAEAAECLGRPYAVSGEVIHGSSRGRSIGFPTANLAFWEEQLIPRTGVYACKVDVGSDVFPAVVNIGQRPTFESSSSAIHMEAHLLDTSQDLYGKTIRVHFIKQIRAERKFSSVKELTQQIQRDVQQAQGIFDPDL